MSMPRDPGPGQVLIKIRAVGICGSDMHWYLEGGIGATSAAYPQILGHEPAGEVVATGAGVEEFHPGQKVLIEPAVLCGHCEFCYSSRKNCCVTSEFMGGPTLYGLFREYATVPAANVVAIPEDMSFVRGTVVEPLAVILHVVELTPVRLGDTVAIMGAGPIGLLTAAVARVSGASRIFVADKVPHRLELARKMGADFAVDSRSESIVECVRDHTRGRGVDVVFDCAAKPDTMSDSVSVARIAGQFVQIGIPSDRLIPFDFLAAMGKELNIQIIKRSNHNAHEAIELLQSGRVSDCLVTHQFPLERTPDAFEGYSSYADGMGKVIIEIP